jgi:threonyl-tRNA synthetase
MSSQQLDHKQIAKELQLFEMHPQSPGMCFWLERGLYLINQIKRAIRSQLLDYQEIVSPALFKQELFHCSGHIEHYQDKMFLFDRYSLKPMNCPAASLVYGSHPRSWRQLPLRIAEFGQVYRHEQSGELNGLLRMNSFVIDDGHIYCEPKQLNEELKNILEAIDWLYQKFGFDYQIEVSGRPKNSIGSDQNWQLAESALREALGDRHYQDRPGEGAFYGPKIDFHLEDSLGRKWQCGSVQVDFALADRLNLNYIDPNDQKQRPVIIHRALVGSLERFLGIVLEHYQGRLPQWLNPWPLVILPISSRHQEYAHQFANQLKAAGIPVSISERHSLGKRIQASKSVHPSKLVIIGDKELKENKLSVRSGQRQFELAPEEAIELIKKDVEI